MARSRKRRVKRQTPALAVDVRKAMARVDTIVSAVDAIESEMPHWEQGWWLEGERAAAADSLAKLECDLPILGQFGEALEDGIALNHVTVAAAAARRAVEALYRLLNDIEGMQYVKGCRILEDIVDDDRVGTQADVGKVQEFLEDVITRVLDDAWDSRDAAIDRETAIVGIQTDPSVVNAESQVHLSNGLGTSHRHIPIQSLEGASAKSWCQEFADDAAAVVVSAVSALDDPNEAVEWLGNANRSLFTNALLQQAVVTVILGNAHSTVYDRYEDAATHVGQLVEFTREDLAHDPSTADVEQDMEELEQACIELLRVVRNAAAHRSASAAIEGALLGLSV